MNSTVAAVFSRTISLPEELFAKKPSGRMWNWVNLWHRYHPTDECDYRKRLLFAFTLKPIIWLFLALFKYAVAAAVSLGLVISKSAVTIAGWRTEPIFKDLDILWSKGWNFNSVDWDIKRGTPYALWEYRRERHKKYPLTGLSVLGTLLFFAMLWVFILSILALCAHHGFAWKALGESAFLAIVSFIALCIFLAGWKNTGVADEIEERYETWRGSAAVRQESVREPEGKKLYFQWLSETLGEDHLPQKVDLSKVPAAFRAPVVHRFRLSYNALKAKVCKPFPRH